jgi:hypothetical protein
VVANIVNENEEKYEDVGPLEMMYDQLCRMRYDMDALLSKQAAELGESNPYENITWTTNGTSTYKDWRDPTRHYPYGYVWDENTRSVIKVST